MTRKQKHLLTRILVAAVLFLAGSLLHLPEYVEMGVFLVCYAVVGWDIVWKAITNILHGQVFDENFLMTIATIGALILGEHSEGVAVMLFYQVGEWFQSYAVSKSRKSIASLMDIRPDYANVEQDGKLVQVDPDEVQIGSVIVVKPGERIPLDGTIIKGSSALDTSALTGESMPREVEPGMEVISGCINQTGILTIQTTKEFGESTVAKILDLVENASDKKGKTENFITRFARYYTPAVVFAALALAVLPPLITGQAFGVWIYRALTFLVISCPCALVISIPLSFFGGIGGASKIGVLVKGSNYLESLAHAEVVVFDNSGIGGGIGGAVRCRHSAPAQDQGGAVHSRLRQGTRIQGRYAHDGRRGVHARHRPREHFFRYLCGQAGGGLYHARARLYGRGFFRRFHQGAL